MRVQGYGVSGGGAGPRRVLPRVRRARHLDRVRWVRRQWPFLAERRPEAYGL